MWDAWHVFQVWQKAGSHLSHRCVPSGSPLLYLTKLPDMFLTPRILFFPCSYWTQDYFFDQLLAKQRRNMYCSKYFKYSKNSVRQDRPKGHKATALKQEDPVMSLSVFDTLTPLKAMLVCLLWEVCSLGYLPASSSSSVCSWFTVKCKQQVPQAGMFVHC